MLRFNMSTFIVKVLFLSIIILTSVSSYNHKWDHGHDCTTLDDGGSGYYDKKGDPVKCECCDKHTKCNVWAESGGLFESTTDFTLPGSGPNLSISRTWNSGDPVISYFGNGWTFNLGIKVMPVLGSKNEEFLALRRENGQEILLEREGDSYKFASDVKYDFSVVATDSGWSLKNSDGSVYEYNKNGRIRSIIDKKGSSLVFTYNERSQLEKVTNASGNFFTFTFYSGKISSITDNLGRTIEYEYDSKGNLTDVVYWYGGHIRYGYDDRNLLSMITNKRGDTTSTITYNQYRQVMQLTERGEIFTFERDTANNTAIKFDSKGRVWLSYYDETGMRVKDVDPMGNTTERAPDYSAGMKGIAWEEDGNGNRTSYSYDDKGNLTEKTDPLGNTETWTYSDDNLVLTYTNKLGVETHYEYDASGNNTHRIEAAGTTIEKRYTYSYDDKGNLVSETDPSGLITTYNYDTVGNMIMQIGAAKDTTQWAYDTKGNMISMTISGGGTWRYQYDENGNVAVETDPLGGITKKEYDFDGNLVLEVNPLNDTTKLKYDAWNRMAYRVGPLGDTTAFTYTAIGDDDLVSGVKDPNNHWTFYEYNQNGLKTAHIVKMNDDVNVADDDDIVTLYTYDDAHNLIAVTDPLGNVSRFGYDENNQKIADTNALGELTAYSYDDGGRMEATTLPNGNVIRYSYNELGQVVSVSDTLGLLNEKKYNSTGHIIWDRTPGLGATSYSFDSTGRIISQVDSAGVGQEYTYNSVGQVVTSTDKMGNATHFRYDLLGRQVWTQNANGDSITFTYDKLGRQTSLTDNEGNTTLFEYDAYGRKTKTVYPDSGVEQFEYDLAGQLRLKIDQNGDSTKFIYDDAGRLLTKEYTHILTASDTYTFDNVGRMLTADNDAAKLSWEYDAVGRPLLYTQDMGDSVYTIRYSYDNTTGSTILIYPDGTKVEKKTDVRNRLDKVITNETTVVGDYDYKDNSMTTKRYGNGVVASYTYDPAGKVTRLTYSGSPDMLPDFEYGYDLSGNKIYAKKHHDIANSETYAYDKTYQLKEFNRGVIDNGNAITTPNYYQKWVFDSRGNWMEFDDNGTVQNRVHNGINELLEIDGASLSYDKKGNLVNDDSQAYTWNGKNQVTDINGNMYYYDALGRRVSKVLSSGTKIWTVYDSWQPVQECWGDSLVKSFTYGLYIDEPITMTTTAANGSVSTCYYHADAQYSIAALTSATGRVLESYGYLPFGEWVIFNSSNVEISESLVGNSIGFTGRYFDDESELFDFRYRNMSTRLGRFLSIDPLRYYSDSLNMFRYVNNSSVNYLDPYGLSKISFTIKSLIFEVDYTLKPSIKNMLTINSIYVKREKFPILYMRIIKIDVVVTGSVKYVGAKCKKGKVGPEVKMPFKWDRNETWLNPNWRIRINEKKDTPLISRSKWPSFGGVWMMEDCGCKLGVTFEVKGMALGEITIFKK